MFALTLQNLPLLAGLVILIGSLLGSTMMFLQRKDRAAQSSGQTGGYVRPADWPSRGSGQPTYHSSQGAGRAPGRARSSILGVLLITGLTLGAGAVGVFAYQSPWSTETDLRHLVASLHCDLARRVGLAPAERGAPGYHARNDRDGNGFACEAIGAGLVPDVASAGLTPKLSSARMVWPEGYAQGSADGS